MRKYLCCSIMLFVLFSLVVLPCSTGAVGNHTESANTTQRSLSFSDAFSGSWQAVYWYDFATHSDNIVDASQPIPRQYLQSTSLRRSLFITKDTIETNDEKGNSTSRKYTWWQHNTAIAIDETGEESTEYIVIDENTIYQGNADGILVYGRTGMIDKITFGKPVYEPVGSWHPEAAIKPTFLLSKETRFSDKNEVTLIAEYVYDNAMRKVGEQITLFLSSDGQESREQIGLSSTSWSYFLTSFDDRGFPAIVTTDGVGFDGALTSSQYRFVYNDMGKIASYQWLDAEGRINEQTHYLYDDRGNIAVERYESGHYYYEHHYQYDAHGKQIQKVVYRYMNNKRIDEKPIVVDYAYEKDKFGREQKYSIVLGRKHLDSITEYDVDGNPIKKIDYRYAQETNAPEIDAWTEYEYLKTN